MEILGRVSEEEKVDRMARAHVHVATSAREGWGLVVSEAAALGTPTIAYNTPGLKDSTLAATGPALPAGAGRPRRLPGRGDARGCRPNPVEPLAYGGAHSWDEVAWEMEDAVLSFLGRDDHAMAVPHDATFRARQLVEAR